MYHLMVEICLTESVRDKRTPNQTTHNIGALVMDTLILAIVWISVNKNHKNIQNLLQTNGKC